MDKVTPLGSDLTTLLTHHDNYPTDNHAQQSHISTTLKSAHPVPLTEEAISTLANRIIDKRRVAHHFQRALAAMTGVIKHLQEQCLANLFTIKRATESLRTAQISR